MTSARHRYFLGFFVLAGVLVMMLALGALIALLSISVGSALRWVVPLSDVIIIGLGILLILNINPVQGAAADQNPGAAASVRQCLCLRLALRADHAALLRAADRQHLRAVAVGWAKRISRMSVFLWFGLGFGLPLLILSFLAGGLQRQITQTIGASRARINLIGGLMLVGIGLYDLSLNWDLISTLLQ